MKCDAGKEDCALRGDHGHGGRPKKFGDFDIAEDGTLSLNGQDKFAVYGANGGLSLETASYKWEGDSIIETMIGSHGTKARVVWEVSKGGINV